MTAPSVVDTEQSLLGAVLTDASVLDEAGLAPEDFLAPAHALLWKTAREMRYLGRAIDVVTLCDELGDRLDAVGGVSYISTLISKSGYNPTSYAEIIRGASKTRAARLLFSRLASSDMEADDLVAAGYEGLSSLVRQGNTAGRQISDIAREMVAGYVSAEARKGIAADAIATGIPELDQRFGGLQRGVISILAGRPSMGKSALARTIADSANAAGHGVHVFSLEDSARWYAARGAADHGRVNLHEIRAGSLSAEGFRSFLNGSDNLVQRKRWIVDESAGLSASDIGVRVRRAMKENRTALVVVDYVQMLRERDVKRADRKANVEVALDSLVVFARQERLAVLLLSQLSRQCEARDDKRPRLSDLRETGELEQAADAVMLLYRDEVYHPDTRDQGIAEIVIAKNKHGRTGMVKTKWDGPTATIRPMGTTYPNGHPGGEA